MTFKKAAPEKSTTKRDGVGLVRVKVILQDPKLQPGIGTAGNLKYEFALENTTVGAVQAAIEAALFDDHK